MLKLFCVLAGDDIPFPVDVDLGNETAGHLKKKIKIKIADVVTCEAHKLDLYLALKDEQWLSAENPAAISPSLPAAINQANLMNPVNALSTYFGTDKTPYVPNRIHVIVVVPATALSPQPPLKKQRREDITFEQFCLKAKKMMPDINYFPSIQDLREFLLRPWPFQTRILKKVLADTVFSKDAIDVDCEVMTAVFNSVPIKCDNKPPSNASELRWAAYYDTFLDFTKTICLGIGLDMDYNRYKEDKTGTTMKTKRPDCLVYTMNGLVLLRGEEKHGIIDIGIPLNELTAKMSAWNPIFYGELPYTLGYATSGALMSIVAIDRYKVIHEIISNVSVTTTEGQGYLLKVFFNLAFFFQRMEVKSKRVTSIRLMPFARMTSGKRTVVLIDGGFLRTYKSSAPDFDRIVNIYQTLKEINRETAGRTHLQMVNDFELKSTKLKVILTPLGFERRPLNVKEAREWIIAMLTALQLWHGSNYCHGDIRWRNIVLVPNESTTSYWVLIDMDESYPPNTRK
ncbi:Crinkler (CRN) family protein, partial [Thraustotheca clavata]